jgi:hypothetical protein
MSTHRTHTLHANSRLAYWQGREDLFSKRENDCLLALRAAPGSTDREVMLALGFSDPNAVRPRLTALIESGVVREAGKIQCAITGKTVRRLEIAPDPRTPRFRGQTELASILKEAGVVS